MEKESTEYSKEALSVFRSKGQADLKDASEQLEFDILNAINEIQNNEEAGNNFEEERED